MLIYLAYLQVKEACAAVTELHGTPLMLTKSKKKASGDIPKLWARQLAGEGSMVKKWRVILRNLPFSVCSLSIRRHNHLLPPHVSMYILTLTTI